MSSQRREIELRWSDDDVIVVAKTQIDRERTWEMFDYVQCRYPLPHYQDAEFQTKDVARIVDPGDPVDGLLDQYVITKTRRLRRQMHKRNAVKTGRKFPSGALKSIRSW